MDDAFIPGPKFCKLRTIAFSCIMTISFVWTVLLFVELYLRWDVSDTLQRGIVVVLALTNAGTIILLIALIILPFRLWLDTARLVLLMAAHGGTAAGFTAWSPGFKCTDSGPGNEGTCTLLNTSILIGSWVVPALLLIYAGCLIAAYIRFNQRPPDEVSIESPSVSEAKVAATRGSVLPLMHPPSATPTTSRFFPLPHPPLPPIRHVYPSPTLPPVTDRRISANTRMSISDVSKRAPRPTRYSMPAASVTVAMPSAPAFERNRKDSMISTSEYSQNSRSSVRATLTKPVPIPTLEARYGG